MSTRRRETALDVQCFERVYACQTAVLLLKEYGGPYWQALCFPYTGHLVKLNQAWEREDESAQRVLLAEPPHGISEDNTVSDALVLSRARVF